MTSEVREIRIGPSAQKGVHGHVDVQPQSPTGDAGGTVESTSAIDG